MLLSQAIINYQDGIHFDDEVLRLWLLNTLPKSWEIFWVLITNFVPNGVVSFQMTKSALNEDMRRKAHSSSSQSDMLVTEIRGRSQKKEPKGGREKSRCKSKSRYKNVEYIIVIKQGTFKNIVLSGKRTIQIKRASRKRMIEAMIVSLLLQVVIFFFFVTLSPLILYQMRACGLLIVMLHYM